MSFGYLMICSKHLRIYGLILNITILSNSDELWQVSHWLWVNSRSQKTRKN